VRGKVPGGVLKTKKMVVNNVGDANVEGQRDQHEQGVKQQTQPKIKETCST